MSPTPADPTFFILKYSTWLDAALFESKLLGAIVREHADPAGKDYLPDDPLQYYKESEFIENTFDGFVVAKMQSNSTEAAASIKSLGGVKLKGEREDRIQLNGKIVSMKRLQRQPNFWKALKDDEVVKKRLPRWMTLRTLRHPVCLVVGIMTCEDVDVAYEAGQKREIGLNGEIPVAQAVAPVLAPVGTDAGNLQADVALRGETKTTFSGKSASKKIFALELKVVTTPYLRKKKVDLYKLKPSGPRAPKGRLLEKEAGGEEMPPVTIEDLDLDELDLDELD